MSMGMGTGPRVQVWMKGPIMCIVIDKGPSNGYRLRWECQYQIRVWMGIPIMSTDSNPSNRYRYGWEGPITYTGTDKGLGTGADSGGSAGNRYRCGWTSQ